MGEPVLDLLPNKPLLGLRPNLLVGPIISSTPRCAPQEQFVSFLKQGLWNTDPQDAHFSISPSCSNCFVLLEHIYNKFPTINDNKGVLRSFRQTMQNKTTNFFFTERTIRNFVVHDKMFWRSYSLIQAFQLTGPKDYKVYHVVKLQEPCGSLLVPAN